MKILTGNDLESGDVVWWTGSGWSRHVAAFEVVSGQDLHAIASAWVASA